MNIALDSRRADRLQGSDPVARAVALAPLITAHAGRIDRERGLPPEVVDALHAAGLFRLLLPRSARGEEVEPAEFVQVIMALAAADASVAWCVGQASGCSMAAAYMDPDAVAVIWGDDPRAVLAWGVGPKSIATVVDGGYRVTGKWDFGSGNRHATWLGGHCSVRERDGSTRMWPDGSPVERTMLFPRGEATIHTGWDVMGLRGTGSDSYSVDDLFVPDAFTVIRDIKDLRREPAPLYRFSTTNIYCSAFGSVALGVGRGALDALIGVAGSKTPSATTRAMRDSAVVQSNVALAEAKLQSARLLLLDTLREAWASVVGGAEMSLDMRMRIRMAGTFATFQAREVVGAAYHEVGATAIFESNPFERRFRDVNSVSQQVQARFSHFETVGAHMLGLSPSLRHI